MPARAAFEKMVRTHVARHSGQLFRISGFDPVLAKGKSLSHAGGQGSRRPPAGQSDSLVELLRDASDAGCSLLRAMAGAISVSYVVAVRALCEFTARQGDLDLRFTPSPSALEGIAGHSTVTSRRPKHYES